MATHIVTESHLHSNEIIEITPTGRKVRGFFSHSENIYLLLFDSGFRHNELTKKVDDFGSAIDEEKGSHCPSVDSGA